MQTIYTIEYKLADIKHTDIYTDRKEWENKINNKSVHTYYFRHVDPITVSIYHLADDIEYTADHSVTDGSIVFAATDTDITDEDNHITIEPVAEQKVRPIYIVEEDVVYKTEDDEYDSYEEAYDVESPAQYLTI